MIVFRSLGGAATVTGSRHLIESAGRRLLIDCGLFQGDKFLRERNWAPFPVPPKSIDAVVLTHAHLDHCGYLPKLVREGFSGPIYCTAATAELAEIILKDSAHIAEKDAEHANRRGYSKHRPAIPLYTIQDAERALEQLRPIAFHSTERLPGGELFFRRAGHILGAASAEIRIDGRTIVFSGDLGRYDDIFMHDPEAVGEADFLFVESTYGDRLHPKVDPMDALGQAIERTIARGGTVVIPAFAVGRAQVLLYHLWMLKTRGRILEAPIFVDSPMAASATDLLCRHHEDHKFPPESCRQSCEIATYVKDGEASIALSANPVPKVIISASGMATGGRVLRHIAGFGPDPRSTILFAGYQAAGTRGAKLLAGDKQTKIYGDWITIRANIDALPMLSAHADSDELVRWIKGLPTPPRRTFIVHGEPAASEALRDRIENDLNWVATVVDPERRYEL